jgi:anaerobic magnesium-protoporphyrin IX monomethyl ester cyclase
MATDCLVVGFNDSNFDGFVNMVASMGTDSGAYRDLNLAFVNYEDKPQRSMDLLNRFYFEGKDEPHKLFHNADFLWPVVTYLGTYLSKRGFTFDYVNLPHLEKERFREKLLRDDILTIAITTTLYVSPHPVIELISFIRQYNDKAKILVGGPYISNQPKLGDLISLQRLFKYLGADIYVISQEGETALVNIINALKNNSSLDGVDNIAYKKGEKYVMTASSTESNALEDNMVDYSLFKSEINEFVTLRTAKSCPFSCAFCGFPQRAGKYKYLSVDLVEKELDAIRDLGGVTTLTFIDDTFNVPKERFREMLRMMIRNNYGFKWNSFYRSDHGDGQTIELMAKAGCEGVFLGVESGSDEMLTRMNKSARRKDYMTSIPQLREVGISTHANVIIGFPGETFGTFEETVSLIEEAKPDFYRAQLWYADPVTPIWNKKDEYGVKGSAFNWSHNTMDYQTACELVDKTFLSIEGSVWLPQNGFEQWSTFYLQRKGMSLEQIKTFLKCFNATIKQKLLCPENKEIDPRLLESLKASCQFDRDSKPDMQAVEVFSKYNASERFWIGEVGNGVEPQGIETLRNEATAGDDGYASWVWEIEKSSLESMARSCGADLPEAVLASYSMLLSRLNGRQSTVIVTATSGLGEKGVLPLKLRPYWEMSFRSFVEDLHEKRLRAMEHQLYAFHILTSPALMAENGCVAPSFEVGFLDLGSEAARHAAGIEEGLKFYPEVADSICLVLEVAAQGENLKLNLAYKKSRFTEETIRTMGEYLSSILRKAETDPDASIKHISSGGEQREPNLAVEAHVSEVFNF